MDVILAEGKIPVGWTFWALEIVWIFDKEPQASWPLGGGVRCPTATDLLSGRKTMYASLWSHAEGAESFLAIS